jgi:hypothetical protein
MGGRGGGRGAGMAHGPQTLTFEAAQWADESAYWLAQATGPDCLGDIRAQVENGTARLFHIKALSATVGAFVLRVDTTTRGAEGVIVSAAAALHGVDMIASCLPAIERMFNGCRAIRYHTTRAALVRRLGAMGYNAAEIVAIKEL